MGENSQSDEATPRWRNFPGDVEALARDWARRSLTTEHWQDEGEWAASESRPRLVHNARLGLSGIAKPGIAKDDGVARAAHEKLAADLAFHLDLPVPPAVLWDRPADDNVHSQVVISAWAFPQPHSWSESQNVLSERERAFANRCMSAMRVFEAWIYATDRKLENVLLTRESDVPETIRMAFVDYAFSLTHTWKEVDEHERAPGRYCDPEDEAAKIDIIARIESFDDRLIEQQIERMPEAFLPREEKRRVARKLAERKWQLRDLVEIGPDPAT